MPIDPIITEASDRDAVMAALNAELDGGPETGFEPTRDGDQVVVAFATVVAHATRQ
jgi:hypothetical protein